MAQIFVGPEATQIIPGAIASIKVQTGPGGNGAAGVVVLIGEADAGPDFSLETLSENAYGPEQVGQILQKYKSGPLVEAFKAAAQPLNDANVAGSPSRIVVVKTNPSVQSFGALLKPDASAYGTIRALNYGEDGNLIFAVVTADQAESLPTTGSFTWINPVGTVSYEMRVNGGAVVGGTLGANTTPAAAVTAFEALAGVSATGGAARNTIQASTGTLALAVVSGNQVTLTYSVPFTTTPSVGDTVFIPTGSVIDGGASDQNVGAYVVTAATSTTISATKLSDAGKGGAVPGTITAPVAVGAVSVSATVANDMVVYAPIVVTLEAGAVSPGLGKSLEIAETTTGTDLLSRAAYALSTSVVTWVSKTTAAKLIGATAEYVAKLAVSRQSDNISEEHVAGGDIGLKVSYKGTTASLVVSDTAFTTTVVGGTGASLALNLSKFPTIADLVAYLNTQTGYSAAAGTAVLGQLPSTALDNGTFGICSTHNAQNGRVKVDGYKFAEKVAESVVIEVTDPTDPDVRPATGLPAPKASFVLASGSKGGTTAAQFVLAVDACQKLTANFIVPCFSRDATLDVADGLTESTSTYTIDAIHAYCRTHVLAMSKVKARKNRQMFLSHQGAFADSKEKAANMAAFRGAMLFQDAKVVASDGTVTQMQPYVTAALAAGASAAAGYKGIVRKFLNVSGIVHAEGDFDPEADSEVEDALKAGLLPIRRHATGGFYFVSDQTTYGKDSNQVYNSIQAVYISDLIALDAALSIEDQFVGQSVADVSAEVVKAALEAKFAEYMRIKWIAPSDDAPAGFKNALVQISGNALLISAEIKQAGLIYFAPIQFTVSMVKQTARQ